MKYTKGFLLSCALLVVLPGCASDFEKDYREPDKFEITAPGDTLTMPADQRAIFVRPKPIESTAPEPASEPGKPQMPPLKDGGPTVLCAEPVPDLALSSLSEISAKLAAAADTLGDAAKPSINAEYLNKLNVTASELAGRNSTVLLTRDLLYRLCEMTANYRPGSTEFKKAAKRFDKIVDAVVLLAGADKAEADANKMIAKAKVETLLDKAWIESIEKSGTSLPKKNLIVAKVLDGGKISTKKVDDLIAKADKESDKISATGQQTLKSAAAIAAASGDVQDFREALPELSPTDLDALWKVAQKS